MIRLRRISFIVLLLFLCSTSLLLGAEETLKVGDIFPDIEFKMPGKSEDKQYLGIGGWGGFKIADIKADVVIIELFSMYCPHCQTEAPLTRELYKIIEKDKKLEGRFKIIGIGINNSDYEVDFFRKKYEIPFPLISDQENVISESMGKVFTPHYIAVRMVDNKKPQVIFSEMGRLEDPKAFLDKIFKLSEEK